MKTTMQELIEFIDDKFIVSNSPQISSIYNKAQVLLEKEKKQIKLLIGALENIVEWDDDFNDAWGSCAEYAKKILEVYNQKK
jgi:hypothetical protein